MEPLVALRLMLLGALASVLDSTLAEPLLLETLMD